MAARLLWPSRFCYGSASSGPARTDASEIATPVRARKQSELLRAGKHREDTGDGAQSRELQYSATQAMLFARIRT
jgi:hypothetical protein